MADVILIRGGRHEVHECITCGVVFTVPERMVEHQRQEGGFHSCPSGHKQGWTQGGSEFEKLRRERDRLKQEQARLEDERREADARADKAEAARRRLKKRVAAGVCPCCHRTVGQLQKHMASKHPGFVSDNGVKLKTA